MTGLLNAQMNVKLASKVQHNANMTVSEGRILERQGITDADEKKVEKGRNLQAKGEEIREGVFEHLEKANADIDAAVKEGQEAAKERREEVQKRIDTARENRKEAEAAIETNTETSTGVTAYKPGEFDVTVGEED